MSKYTKAILEINPNAEVIVEIPNGTVETYDMIQWVQPDQQIDQATLDAKVTEIATRDAHIEPRRKAYPSFDKQLEMMYDDQVNGTTTWVDAIAQVKADFPKSE
nr:hypothetical protein MEP432_gp41 [Methylophilales phage MEP432]